MLTIQIKPGCVSELPSPQAAADRMLEGVLEGTHKTFSPGFLQRILRRVAEATGEREKELLENIRVIDEDGTALQLLNTGLLEPTPSLLCLVTDDASAAFYAALDKLDSSTPSYTYESHIIHDKGPEPEEEEA